MGATDTPPRVLAFFAHLRRIRSLKRYRHNALPPDEETYGEAG